MDDIKSTKQPSEIKRVVKGEQTPENKGQGSIFLIPADDMPEGLISGKKYKIILEGLVNLDEQGATVNVDRIYSEEFDRRVDPTQQSLESGLKIEISRGNK